MCLSILRRWVALQMSRCRICRVHLNRFVADADPAWRALFLMRLRFVLCCVALAAFRQAIRPCGLKNFSVNAAPPTWLAISDRVFFRCKPLTALLSAFHVGHLD
jgi:hypothetical protein